MAGLRVRLRLGRRRPARRASRRWATSRWAASSRSSPGTAFVAERGAGSSRRPRLSGEHRPQPPVLDVRLPRAPGRPTAEVLGELIDGSSVGGGTFDLGSATFDMTRIVTGQLDAYVEPGPLIVAEVPGHARASSSGSAAARCSTTRPTTWPPRSSAWRRAARSSPTPAARRCDDRPLLGSGAEFQMSCVAAANAGAPRARSSPRSRRESRDFASSRTSHRYSDAGSGRALACRDHASRKLALGHKLAGGLQAPRRPRPDRGDPRAGRAARGQAGPARQRHRDGRRRLGDPLRARAADARRRARRALAGDPRPRGVLQRHQDDAQRAPGQPGSRSPTSSGRSSTRTTR